MNRKLTAKSSLETLRKEAKRWLKAVRGADASARERLRRAYPHAPAEPGLRDVQHALAREHGAESWAALKQELDALAVEAAGRDKLLADFLEHSCIHYGRRPATSTWDRTYADTASRRQYAARILARHPELARDSIHAAAVSGNVSAVERLLRDRPQLVHEKGGPQHWQPLLYVCYGRLPTVEAGDNAVEVARRLLAAGANAGQMLGDDEDLFTALTGAIGEGEMSQPPHASAAALAELLIEHGADPFDAQALYNTSLEGESTFWLDFLYGHSARRDEQAKWTAARTDRFPRGMPMVNYLLGNAVSRNAVERVQWLLARGADPNTAHFYTKRKVHAEAVSLGFAHVAQLLERAGAARTPLGPRDEFMAACMSSDLDAITALVRAHPEYLQDAAALTRAAERDLLDVATRLLDLGTSPDVRSHTNFRPLHAAASRDSVRVGKLLVERGAEIDPQEMHFNGTPLTWAIFYERPRMTALLGPLSRNPKSLVRWGDAEHLQALLAADPRLAKTVDANGSLLFYLPADEDRALEIAELLLAYGADPLVKGREGNAIEAAERRGLEAVGQLLRTRGASSDEGD